LGVHLLRVIPTKIFRFARAHNDTFLWKEVLVSNLVLPHLITIGEKEKARMIAGNNVLEFHTSIWIYERIVDQIYSRLCSECHTLELGWCDAWQT
jgi:hypothetical protein